MLGTVFFDPWQSSFGHTAAEVPPHLIEIACECQDSISCQLHGRVTHKTTHSACFGGCFPSLVMCISSLPLRVTKMTDLSSSTGHQALALLARWATVATLQLPILLSITADQVIEKQPHLFSRLSHYFILCSKQWRLC